MPGLVERPYKEIYEDWTGAEAISTAVADGIMWLVSSDGGNTAFRPVATNAGVLCRAATDGDDDDMCEIGHQLLAWSVQNGQLGMETRIRVSTGTVTDVALSVGFTDDILEDSNTLPVELSTTTFTANAAEFVGVIYDTDATNDNFHAVWVDDTAVTSEAIANLRFTGITPVADQWVGIRIVLSDRGAGNLVRGEFTVVNEQNGRTAQKTFNATIDRDALLTPHIAFENRGSTAHSVDIDYIKVWQSRGEGTTGG